MDFKVLFFLITLNLVGYSQTEAPPKTFDKELFMYKVIKEIAFDFDQAIKDLGMKVHSCKITTTKKEYAFTSLGNCLLVAIDSSIKSQNHSIVKLWVLNENGQYLQPLIINWKVAQKSWIKFLYEFIELSFEDFFNFFRRSNDKTNPCALVPSEFLTKDLGNFIGHLEIRAQEPWRLSDYFKNEDFLKTTHFKNANGIELTAKSPEYVNGKKMYEVRALLDSTIDSSFEGAVLLLNIRTNFNLTKGQDFLKDPRDCIHGHGELLPKSKEVVP